MANPLINRSRVKALALELADNRFRGIPGYKMDRVSKSFLDGIEADVRNLVRTRINQLPAKGQTIT
jgi:hypothetical protein